MATSPSRPEIKFAPREIFEHILEWSVIPTFDLIVEMPENAGIVLVRRTIAPYKDLWALPGLRMFKPESIDDTLTRIARDELSVEIDVSHKRFLGQYVGRFTTECQRQDLSSGYTVKSVSRELGLNLSHFSDYRLIKTWEEVPRDIGSMYLYYLSLYFGHPTRGNYDAIASH